VKESMEENLNANENQELGTIKISEEVVSVIAGLAATEVPGVAGMSGGVVNGISEMLGRVRIPEVAWNVQENVKNAVENMTGLKVVEVNIHVQGVNMDKENKKQEQQVKEEEN
jgi:uncharacterized alkaline shock family protein YloU